MKLKSSIRNRKMYSLFLSAVLGVNTCAMVKMSTKGSDSPDAKETRSNIIERATAYLDTRKSADGSIGDARTVNDTAYALKAYRKAEKSGHEDSRQWLADNVSYGNTDMTARLAAACGDQEYLNKLEISQNKDGGFGLYPNYASEVLDSALVLGAINETGYTGGEISGVSICSYLFSVANSDGGYAYSEGNESDPELTAMVVYNVGNFLRVGNYDISPLDAPVSYLEDQISNSYTDSGISATISKYLAFLAVGEEFDEATVVDELSRAEKSDGSFAGDVRTTSLAIELLSSLDLENSVNVTTFSTTLSVTESKPGSATPIKANTTIGYKSNCDAALDLVFTVYSDGISIYENSTEVSLSASSTSIDVESGEFRINDPDSEVYAVAELKNGDITLKSQRINIELTGSDTVYSTEVSRLAVTTDRYSAFTGTDGKVNVKTELLYATNIENNADIKTTVTKDGAVIEERTEAVVLVPEKNSVSPEMLTFSADTSAPGVYKIGSVCLHEGTEVASSETEFTVLEAPEIEDETEDGTTTQFEVTWFGPILSEYYVYAGGEKEINVGAEINYYSNGPFKGSVKLEVYGTDEELLTDANFDVELEKGVPTYFEGRAQFPVFKSEDQLSFVVSKKGQYRVVGKLFDSEGELMKEETRDLAVVEKPVQDLILNTYVDTDQENMIDLTWNDISNDAETYSYQLNRRTDGGKWEPRSIWNEEEHIRVLNVYPYQPFLVDWMNTTISDTETPAGKGIFEIEPVHISTFNSDPASYLYNDDGSWKCDVIFFGTSDSNSYIDLGEKSIEELQKFIDSGRGVLFGHDTITQSGFNHFAEQAGLWIGPSNISRTTSVSVVKIGTLTNYPWVIRGDLTVPNTHTTGQYIVDATEWITLNNYKRTDPSNGYTDGFYLCTKDNLGMIQTGDSTGQATDDERKVIANTLFYLYQISQQTTAKDASFYDIDAPDQPELISSQISGGQVNVTVKSADNPTDYEYYITATPGTPGEDNVVSNVHKHTAFADLAGFVVKLSAGSDPDPGLIEYNETRDQILDVIPADKNGRAVLTAVPIDFSQPQYIHIFAVDNANNISEEYIMPFAENDISTEISLDSVLYSYGDKVTVNASTLSAPFGRTADVKVEIIDEAGLIVAELIAEKDVTLAACEIRADSAEWTIPADTVGRFTAVITWTKDGETIAEASSVFRISNEESVVNTIVSDKQRYTIGDPVNLDHMIFNESKGMTENDLRLVVKVYKLADSSETATYEHNVGLVDPDSNKGYHDAVAPIKLTSGEYRAEASVFQGETELSSDSTEFTVTEDVTSIAGDLELSASGENGRATVSVTNKGTSDLKAADLSVTVYKEGIEDAVFTFNETADIKAGETIDLSRDFDLPDSMGGNYFGVLRAEYNGESFDLDYDGFDLPLVTITTTSATTTATTMAETTKKLTNTSIDSPKTGDNQIPAYMWIIFILSIAGLVGVRMTGGNINEED